MVLVGAGMVLVDIGLVLVGGGWWWFVLFGVVAWCWLVLLVCLVLVGP